MNKNKKIGIILSIFIILMIVSIIIFSLLSKPIYKVEFDTGDGSKVNTIEVAAKDTIKRPSDPTKDGYVFDNWYYQDKIYDFNTKVTKDMKLIAKWIKEEQNLVTLSFNTDGGSKVENIKVELGTILENIPNPTKAGYNFLGWYYKNKKFDFTNTIKEDMTFTAKWGVDKSTKYKITFDSNGGSKVESIEVKKGSVVPKPTTPIKDGYKFIGWYLNNSEYNFESIVTKDITLTAKWQKN